MATLKDLLGIELTSDLSEEDLVNAIQNKLSDNVGASESEKNLKSMISKRNSEIADLKNKLKERMTAEEAAEAERAEHIKTLEAEVASYRREKDISGQYADYISLGFDEGLAMETATALVDGDLNKVTTNLKKFVTGLVQDTQKQTLANAMKNISAPEGGDSTRVYTKEDLNKMSGQERLKFYKEHPEEYAQIYSDK